jgi:hypothetical protein
MASTDWSVVSGWPKEKTGLNSFSAELKLIGPWDDRFAQARRILGISGGILTSPTKYMDLKNVRAKEIGIEPLGDRLTDDSTDDSPLYEKAIITVNYNSDNDISTESGDSATLMEESLEPDVNFVSAPWRKLFWKTDGYPLTEAETPQFPVSRIRWNVVLYNLKTLPTGLLTDSTKCNATAIKSNTLGVTFPAETLLYLAGSPKRLFTTEGVSSWTCAMSFIWQPFSWNKFFRRGVATPQELKDSGGTDFKPVTAIDFATALNIQIPPT